ncbi:MAG: SDR family oxidoreductase [Pseudomonadota bacterium]
MRNQTLPGIADSLAGKHIVVIGATGFLGKVLVEALLREAPDLAKLTLLVRAGHKGEQPTMRIARELLATPLFRQLRDAIGETDFNERTARIEAVAADINQPRLGLDALRYQSLAESADLIINSAASVNFREALDKAMLTNMHAVDRLASFAARRNIPLLHISTCYVNGVRRGLIAEDNGAPSRAKRAAGPVAAHTGMQAWNTDHIVGDLETAVDATAAAHRGNERARNEAMVTLGQEKARQYGWNDCYTLTKWLAEQRLMARRPNGPLTVLRPSIIESTARQPFGGWLEGIKVADAVIYAYAKRGLSVFPGHKDRVIDVIPVDVVANSALFASAELLTAASATRVYQCCSGSSNPLTIGQLRDYVVEGCRDNWDALPRLFAGRPRHGLRIVPPALFHTAAAGTKAALKLAEWFGARRLPGAPDTGGGRRVSRFTKMQNLVSLYAFYASPDYVFSNEQLQALHRRFPSDDRARLPVDTEGLDWRVYIRDIHLPGLHRFALRPEKRRVEPAPAAGEFCGSGFSRDSAIPASQPNRG